MPMCPASSVIVRPERPRIFTMALRVLPSACSSRIRVRMSSRFSPVIRSPLAMVNPGRAEARLRTGAAGLVWDGYWSFATRSPRAFASFVRRSSDVSAWSRAPKARTNRSTCRQSASGEAFDMPLTHVAATADFSNS